MIVLWAVGAVALAVILAWLAIELWIWRFPEDSEERLLTEAEAEEMTRPLGNVHVLDDKRAG